MVTGTADLVEGWWIYAQTGRTPVPIGMSTGTVVLEARPTFTCPEETYWNGTECVCPGEWIDGNCRCALDMQRCTRIDTVLCQGFCCFPEGSVEHTGHGTCFSR
jgi:hypothetical protein